MRSVVLDPELLAAGILARTRPRRLLGLLAYGRVAQFVDLLGPADLALIADELAAGGRAGGVRIEQLVAAFDDRRALLTDRLPYGAPDDLVLVSSIRIIGAAVERVEHARSSDPVARRETDLAERARRIINWIALGIPGDILAEASPTESLRDHIVHIAATATAAIVSDDAELAPTDGKMWRHIDPLSGREAIAVTSATYVQGQIETYPFAFDAVPLDLLDIAVAPIRIEGP